MSPGSAGVVARPGLFARLRAAARVTVVSAPAGSGKTMLLRSWVSAAGLGASTAWVPVRPGGERDPQSFWLSACWTPCGAPRPGRGWYGS